MTAMLKDYNVRNVHEIMMILLDMVHRLDMDRQVQRHRLDMVPLAQNHHLVEVMDMVQRQLLELHMVIVAYVEKRENVITRAIVISIALCQEMVVYIIVNVYGQMM